MAKELVLAVAGSGKTRLLIDRLNNENKFLIVTYTNNNSNDLKSRIYEKYGHIPENVRLYTYFSFLNQFCFKPFLNDRTRARGINFENPPDYTRFTRGQSHYLDGNKKLYLNRLSKLVDKGCIEDVCLRLAKYYDSLLVDEVQDFGGHDLNFLCSLGKANIDILLVGDFYQHTFDTSRDGRVNSQIYKNIEKYISKLSKAGYEPNRSILSKSHRCSPAVCEFIRENLGVQIESNRKDTTRIHFVSDKVQANHIFADKNIVKLFYNNHNKYPCYSENWGKSKGQDHYGDVCVVLNKSSYAALKKGTMATLAHETKAKLYVACTRARGDLFFISNVFFDEFFGE